MTRRWSWAAFACGGLVGAALAALLLASSTEAPAHPDLPREAAQKTDPVAPPAGAEPGPGRGSSRPRRTPRRSEASGTEEELDEAVEEDSEDAPGMPRTDVLVSAGVPLLGELFRPASPRSVDLRAEWARARELADARAGAPPDAEAVARLLDTGTGPDFQAGIWLASRLGLVEPLAQIAGDPRHGFYRALALRALAPLGGDAVAAETLLRHLRDEDALVREAAVAALPGLGERGVEAASRLLRDGEFARETLAALTTTVVRGGRGLETLRAGVSPAVALALVRRFEDQLDSLSAEQRQALATRLPGVIRTLFEEPGVADRVPQAFGLLAKLEAYDFLEEVATSARVADAARMAALDVVRKSDPERGARIVERILGDLTTPVDFLRQVVAAIAGDPVGAERFQALLLGLAANHPNPWVRQDALHALAWIGSSADGGLQIVGAVYGKNGKTVDVTAALREAVRDGRLRVVASNSLAGDPNVGTIKELRVEYRYRGRLSVRTVGEGRTLVLP